MQLTAYSNTNVIVDAWVPVRGFVEAFNARRMECIVPVRKLCVDELMSSWEGVELKYHAAGMPHINKIARKPKGVGAEVKCVADCDSGVMLKLEVQEGKSCKRAKADSETVIRRNISYSQSMKCHSMVNDLFDGFNAIDVHDRNRQGTLGLERHWRTHIWWQRVFATIFGIIITDAYFFYRLEFHRKHGTNDEQNKIEPFKAWVESLAAELVFNNIDDTQGPMPLRNSPAPTSTVSPLCMVSIPIFGLRFALIVFGF